tara:strand:+ start:530 stop:850 length:321 start_codon:yes stop_codon:yes gene_type:complete
MAVLGTQVIKSIQRGSASIAPGGFTTATITAVDLSKSFVSVSSANGFKAGKANNTSNNYTSYGAGTSFGGSLTGTTSLYLISGTGPGSSSVSSGNGTAYWEVIEYV